MRIIAFLLQARAGLKAAKRAGLAVPV